MTRSRSEAIAPRPSALGPDRGELVRALPSLAAVGVFLALAASEAGFYPLGTDAHRGLGWYQGALLLLVLLAASRLGLGRPPRPHPLVLAAMGFLAAYTAWTFFSIAWADDAGAAWNGANRTTMYLLAFALFCLWPSGPRHARFVMGAFGLGMAALAMVQLLRLGASASPIDFFIGVRLAEPAGYINANVALWTLGLFVCVMLAAARTAPLAVRGPALGGAGLLAGLALMGQSRGWAPALPVAVLLFVAIVPDRGRVIAALAAVAFGTFAAAGPILAVHDRFDPGRFDALVGSAVTAILLLTSVLTLLGFAAALADRRLPAGARPPRRLSLAAAAVAAALVVTGGGVALTVGDAPARVSDAWQDFKAGSAQPEEGRSRFTASGNNRYDFWRVAWELFEEEPLVGIGTENFHHHYLERARSTEKPRYAHSLELGVVAQTGLVGAILLFGGVLAALAAAARAVLRGRRARLRSRPQGSPRSPTGSCMPPWTGCGSSRGSPHPPSHCSRSQPRSLREPRRRNAAGRAAPPLRGRRWPA